MMAPASSASAPTPRGAAPTQAQARAHHGAAAGAGTTTTTILRVKRRRDEPPSHLPDTILLSAESLGGGGGAAGAAVGTAAAAAARRRASKRSRRGNRDDEALAGLMGRSTFITTSASTGTASDNGRSTSSTTGGSRSNDQGAVRSAVGETSQSGGTSGAAGGGSGARFRRVPGGDLSALVLAGEDASGSALAVMGSKRVRVVDARICRRDSNGDDDDTNENGGKTIEDTIAAGPDRDRPSSDATAPRRKRARLVLDIVTARDVTGGDCDSDKLVNSGVEFWKSVASESDTGDAGVGSSSGGTPIMDPVTRSVDSSLQAVFRHEKTVTQHLVHLQMDSLVVSMAQPRSERWVKLLNHTSSSAKAGGGATGTALHAAAIFNDLDGARCALDHGIDPSLPDGDGHTALFIAETVGSIGVAALLSSHVGMHDYGNDNRQDEHEDDSDYVFDVYCLAGTKESARERDDWDAWDESMGRPSSFNDRPAKHKETNGEDTTKIQADDDASGDSSRNIEDECRVEIKGGVGYWNEAGELVLEADKMNGGKTSADDVSFADADDHDSNDEGYGGNDYPDEDGDADEQSDADAYMVADSTFGRHGAGYSDSSDEEGLALYGRSYRHDAIPAPAASGWSNVWSDTAQLADDSDEDGHNLSGFGVNDPDIGDDGGEYGGPLGRVTYGETGLYGEGGACAYDPEQDEEE
mmetsp:Transcript_12636/g.26758  ORF Transcript_12636/g.26758 Transcript_12636/m.26758 type:complete len:696 (+) Transcript_12636:110-2197(+)